MKTAVSLSLVLALAFASSLSAEQNADSFRQQLERTDQMLSLSDVKWSVDQQEKVDQIRRKCIERMEQLEQRGQEIDSPGEKLTLKQVMKILQLSGEAKRLMVDYRNELLAVMTVEQRMQRKARIAMEAIRAFQRPKTWYEVQVKNESRTPYDNVAVKYPGYEFTHGVLGPGGESSHMDVKAPFPEKANVSWTTPEGQRHEQQVDVPSKPADKRNLSFSITETDAVHVRWFAH